MHTVHRWRTLTAHCFLFFDPIACYEWSRS
jgi:hypothetical protein